MALFLQTEAKVIPGTVLIVWESLHNGVYYYVLTHHLPWTSLKTPLSSTNITL